MKKPSRSPRRGRLTALIVGILKYSRDLAFTAASAYADAAKAFRGSWDSRMEASIVDAVVRGDTGPELLSRAAALDWDATAPGDGGGGNPGAGPGKPRQAMFMSASLSALVGLTSESGWR